jgi:hypothetical protein
MWYLRNVSKTWLQDKVHEYVTANQNPLLDKRSIKLITSHVVFNGNFTDNNKKDLWVQNLMCAMWIHTDYRVLSRIIFTTMVQMFGRNMQLQMLCTKDLILCCTLYYLFPLCSQYV